MAHNYRRTLLFMLNDHGNIGGVVMQGKLGHWPGAGPDATGLRSQYSKAVRSKLRSHDVVVFRAAAKRWQNHYDGTRSLREDLNAYIAAGYHLMVHCRF
jgi:hypothetical protein